MKRYYIVTNKGLKQLLVQKPDPLHPGRLVEKCIWCNDMEPSCEDCKEWYSDIADLKRLKAKELSEKEVFLKFLSGDPDSEDVL